MNIRFLGNLTLNLWDCGGQYRFFESYFENDTMFRNVEVLIYVFGEFLVNCYYLTMTSCSHIATFSSV